jgi:hypothetical protein
MAAKPRRRDKRQRRKSLAAKAPRHEEIRFAKNKQWAVTGGGLAIMVAVYGIASAAKPLSPSEDLIVWGVMLATPLLCFYFLWSLQEHLAATRLELDTQDKDAFRRGLDIVGIFATVLFACSIMLLYALHRG